jgi:hypothetical protein
VEDFFTGTGISVEEYTPDHVLSLLTDDMVGRPMQLCIVAKGGRLKVWREYVD